jgi:precorrin-6B methylase 2
MTGADIPSASGLAGWMAELPSATLRPRNLVTVRKTNMINEIPCGCGTLRTTAVRIWHQVSRGACAEVSAALEVSRRPAQMSQQLQNLTILIVKSRSILNTPP